MQTEKVSVRDFIKRLKAAGACNKGIASFMRKRGSVKQRLAKMCEVANRSWQYDEDRYLRWLYYRPTLGVFVFYDANNDWRTYD